MLPRLALLLCCLQLPASAQELSSAAEWLQQLHVRYGADSLCHTSQVQVLGQGQPATLGVWRNRVLLHENDQRVEVHKLDSLWLVREGRMQAEALQGCASSADTCTTPGPLPITFLHLAHSPVDATLAWMGRLGTMTAAWRTGQYEGRAVYVLGELPCCGIRSPHSIWFIDTASLQVLAIEVALPPQEQRIYTSYQYTTHSLLPTQMTVQQLDGSVVQVNYSPWQRGLCQSSDYDPWSIARKQQKK